MSASQLSGVLSRDNLDSHTLGKNGYMKEADSDLEDTSDGEDVDATPTPIMSRASTPGGDEHAALLEEANSTLQTDKPGGPFIDLGDLGVKLIGVSRNKGKSRQGLTRYSSVTSVASNEDAPSSSRRASSRSTSRPPSGVPSDAVIWTRYGVQVSDVVREV